jgi:hypothetical protein
MLVDTWSLILVTWLALRLRCLCWLAYYVVDDNTLEYLLLLAFPFIRPSCSIHMLNYRYLTTSRVILFVLLSLFGPTAPSRSPRWTVLGEVVPLKTLVVKLLLDGWLLGWNWTELFCAVHTLIIFTWLGVTCCVCLALRWCTCYLILDFVVLDYFVVLTFPALGGGKCSWLLFLITSLFLTSLL